ncbi:protein phosphatase [Leptospira gomenensis]|uniref:Protein phosphatase n=1 Tax=Leptospira gomenensis TaxID=2484974 RepID=A0A5F1Z0F7_9LEPT|nr:SpoIIE family protein phosphatase [Leptospira gomenensis]TGK31034.1 protein phosphatase [Leptospira gomenensis]TGK43239.1 protein phosphatase [Leptospira gomenensis]TGK45246.1 protein phosphatase [Leptospira gomenensis]TGK66161.1 protein phosphatase [Leptospira gomenensis]
MFGKDSKAKSANTRTDGRGKKRRSLRSLILSYIILFLCSCSENRAPIAESGVLDASSWNFDRDGLVLRGEWTFYWGRWKYFSQPHPDENEGGVSEIVYVPSTWNGDSRKGKGFGSYVLDVKLPEISGPLGLILPDQSSAYELFLDDKLVSVSGEIVRDKEGRVLRVEEGIRPRFLEFQPSGKKIGIVLQIANEDLRLGGFWSPIFLGKSETVRDRWNRSLRADCFLAGGLLVMSVLHLIFYLMRKKETQSLYFGLFCLLMGIRSVVAGNRVVLEYTEIFNYENILRTEYLTFYLSVPVFLNYVISLYPRDLKRVFVDVLWWISLIASGVVVFFPMRIFTHTIPLYYLNAFVAGSLGLITLIRAAYKKREGSRILLAGFVFIYLAMINDLLYVNYFVETGYYSSVGTFVFLAAQSVSLSVRNSKNMQRLLELSRNLERMVEERTLRLKDALRSIEEDLTIAGKLQIDLLELPENEFLVKNRIGIHTAYRPISQVGGDFYVVRSIGPQRIRIFLADAIGHGVQASLVTVVIQSEYDSIFDPELSPGDLLTALSERFSARVGDMSPFFSGMIADLDLQENRIRISNAGNPPCILFQNGEAKTVQRIGPYAGMIPNHRYEETVETLSSEFRMFFFTDGLPDRFIFSESEYENFSIERTIETQSQESLQTICDTLTELADSLGLPDFKKDDITLLAIERSNSG